MTIRILETAKRDLIMGFHFYERQAQGLGDYFLDSLYSDIDSLLIYHGIHPMKFGGYYCMLSKRFPFAVYYTINKEVISIEAVLDCRQNPDTTQSRMEE